MIANLGYPFTFGVCDPAILARSLFADIALPVLLLAQLPAFLGRVVPPVLVPRPGWAPLSPSCSFSPLKIRTD